MDEWRVIEEREMPGDMDAEIRRGLCLAFPDDASIFAKTRVWHGSAPAWSVILRRDGPVAAHVGVVDRTVTAGGAPVRVAGVMNVYVEAALRGGGLGKLVMRRAMEEAGRRGFDAGLLFCVRALEGFYASAGWTGLDGREVARVDGGREVPLPDKNMPMYHPLAAKEFPAGRLHLGGNDW